MNGVCFVDTETTGLDLDPEAAAEDFEPVSTDDANRLLWHLRQEKASIAHAQALYQAEAERLGLWLVDRTEGAQRRVEALERTLEGWARMVHTADPKAKTFDLPNGVIRVRPARAHVEISDPDEMVRWAFAAKRFDLLNITPAKGNLASLTAKRDEETEDCLVDALLTEEGERVPGVASVTAKAPTVTVTPAKEWGKTK